MEKIDFEHLDVEDRLLKFLRAAQSGDKLRRKKYNKNNATTTKQMLRAQNK